MQPRKAITLNSRQRLRATLNHDPVDRVCVDFGSGFQTGLGAAAVHRLRREILQDESWRVKIIEPYQMLGEIDEQLRRVLELDIIGVHSSDTMFGFRSDEGWKSFTLFDGTPVSVPQKFNTTFDKNGGLLIYPEGDVAAPPRGRMPKDGHFFDTIVHNDPIDESRLDVTDNCEEFTPIAYKDVEQMAETANRYACETDYGIYLTLPGCGFGDIALVPAPWMRHPSGIRDVEEWYISTLTRPDYIRAVFDCQLECALETIDRLAKAVGDNADIAFVSGTDFGA